MAVAFAALSSFSWRRLVMRWSSSSFATRAPSVASSISYCLSNGMERVFHAHTVG